MTRQPNTHPERLSPAFPDRAAWGTVPKLRAWQAAALEQYREQQPKDFLAVATPGAGKTSFALTLAAELIERRVVSQIIVVAPTEHLKTQWAEAAARIGIAIDPEFGSRQGGTSTEFQGFALTYAGVATNPNALRIRVDRTRTLVILDEIHHAGDARSWGEAVREAFDPATRRLSLTGTPFRSDTNPIPFVRYEHDGTGQLRSKADYSYGYGEALADGIVRPVLFMAYSGEMSWRTRAGDEIAARLGEPLTKDLAGQALRTALDPAGAWMPTVLAAADRRLTEVRETVPDAGGLVIATDQTAARAYAEILRSITGRKPTLVLSDEAGSGRQITRFSDGDDRWMVAVRMVSEGVDVPRLAVGVYATTTMTPLFFAQAVGRFVRARTKGETASVFLPSIETLLRHAAELETERDHALRAPERTEVIELDELVEEVESGPDPVENQWAALESEADFDRVLFDGGEYGLTSAAGSADEAEYLGLPGLLEADQVRELLQRRQAEQVARTGGEPRQRSTHSQLRDLRKELNGLVAAWHHRTGEPHGVIHSALVQSTGGPPSAMADSDQLQERIDTIRHWAITRAS